MVYIVWRIEKEPKKSLEIREIRYKIQAYSNISVKFHPCRRGSNSLRVIIIGNGHSNPSSNPGWGCLHFT